MDGTVKRKEDWDSGFVILHLPWSALAFIP